MEKMIVIGASGFLGTAIVRLASQKYRVIATYRGRPCPVTNSNTEHVRLDFGTETTVETLKYLIGENDVVVIASNIEYGHQNELSFRNYQDFLRTVTVHGIKIVFVSSDAVFDGRQTYYSEETTPNPISEYGKRKLDSEKIVGEGQNVIIRTSYLYGSNGYKVDKRIEEIKHGVIYKKVLNRYKGMIRNPIHVIDLADTVLRLKDEEGIFHVAGPAMSVYDFSISLAKEAGIDVEIREIKPDESEKTIIPMNTNLISIKLESLGISIPKMEDYKGRIYFGSRANCV